MQSRDVREITEGDPHRTAKSPGAKPGKRSSTPGMLSENSGCAIMGFAIRFCVISLCAPVLEWQLAFKPI